MSIARVGSSRRVRTNPLEAVGAPKGTIHQRLVPAPLDITFGNEREAETYAVQMAKRRIDDNG